MEPRTRTSDATNTGSHYNNTNAYVYTDQTPSHSINIQSTGSNDMNAPDTYWRSNGDNIIT